MNELASTARLISSRLPTCVQRINHPIHQGKPNPAHGHFFFTGSVPASCITETGRSRIYATEQLAIDAALAAGVTHLQGADCRKIVWS